MTDIVVKVLVEVLNILAIATEEFDRGQTSECTLHITLLLADIGSESLRHLKKPTGRSVLEGGMKRLDKLTQELARMVSANLLKIEFFVNVTRSSLILSSLTVERQT